MRYVEMELEWADYSVDLPGPTDDDGNYVGCNEKDAKAYAVAFDAAVDLKRVDERTRNRLKARIKQERAEWLDDEITKTEARLANLRAELPKVIKSLEGVA
jgi:hypothetical protein